MEDQVYFHVKTGMTVGITEGDGNWWIADVLNVEYRENESIPSRFKVAEVGSGFITWVDANRVTHIVPTL
ncbi:DUF3104 domain-containing protein [Synechococcus sp. RS9907]|uniref:DUF3104 domain-containing protein n=1 Tax=Synechococcus sp. RS9907 TaxID=221350 RepID=UPI00165E8525|nr:DUF3104 domain-containing protein [Synechococcus sp. RS9907]